MDSFDDWDHDDTIMDFWAWIMIFLLAFFFMWCCGCCCIRHRRGAVLSTAPPVVITSTTTTAVPGTYPQQPAGYQGNVYSAPYPTSGGVGVPMPMPMPVPVPLPTQQVPPPLPTAMPQPYGQYPPMVQNPPSYDTVMSGAAVPPPNTFGVAAPSYAGSYEKQAAFNPHFGS